MKFESRLWCIWYIVSDFSCDCPLGSLFSFKWYNLVIKLWLFNHYLNDCPGTEFQVFIRWFSTYRVTVNRLCQFSSSRKSGFTIICSNTPVIGKVTTLSATKCIDSVKPWTRWTVYCPGKSCELLVFKVHFNTINVTVWISNIGFQISNFFFKCLNVTNRCIRTRTDCKWYAVSVAYCGI